MSADTTDTTTEAPKDEVVETEAPAAADVPAAPVTAQEQKSDGTDSAPLSREDAVAVNSGEVDAQVAQPREDAPTKVAVHEVAVQTDTVITDTSDPNAVIVPEAGRSPLEKTGLPISRLDAERVEDVFAREASEPDKS